MKVKCIENNYNNQNFTLGKAYDMTKTGMKCDYGGMRIRFDQNDKPDSFNPGSEFHFAMCRFKIID